MFDFAERRQRFYIKMQEASVDLAFIPRGSDLEYLTGTERRVVTFGNIAYAHHWVAGTFFAPGHEPVSVMPRMIKEFDSPKGIIGDAVVVNELDDPVPIFTKVAMSFPRPKRIAVSARSWAETVMHLRAIFPDAEFVSAETLINPLRRIKSAAELDLMTKACHIVDSVLAGIQDKVRVGVTETELASEISYQMKLAGSRTDSFDTAVWSMGPGDDRDATVRLSLQPLRAGMGVSFDFGSVVDGYCSDFGRTIHVGDPGEEYVRVYELVMAAQAAGIAAAKPGATAAQVHHACRQVIVDGGYGDWFRHRTGHCIGLDVHEYPFISEEDDTPLEEGMTFTIEPSVFWPGRVGVRVEDVIVCEAAGGRKLNAHPTTLVAT
jgi:Xaa-Pro aminopeptidase